MDCRGCGYGKLDTVFVMAPIPLAGAFAETQEAALAAERYPLEWRTCRRCSLVNVWPQVDERLIFDSYSYRASDVPALVRHHARFARWLQSRFQPNLHVEIGGNDGVLVRHIPWPTINIDPSDAWVGPGHNVPFTSALARSLPKADLITSSNAFAHFGGIADAFDGIRDLLTEDGVFVMEVHDLDRTVDGYQWDTIYHEHAVEWSEHSITMVAYLHGLELLQVERLGLHGGLLRAVIRKRRGGGWLPTLTRPQFRHLQDAYDNVYTPPLPRGSIAYGAAARATVYLDHIRPNVDFVVDASPRRAGRFVPGVGLPIRPPSEMGDPPAAIITARGHERDIMAAHPDYRGWRPAPLTPVVPIWVEAFG